VLLTVTTDAQCLSVINGKSEFRELSKWLYVMCVKIAALHETVLACPVISAEYRFTPQFHFETCSDLFGFRANPTPPEMTFLPSDLWVMLAFSWADLSLLELRSRRTMLAFMCETNFLDIRWIVTLFTCPISNAANVLYTDLFANFLPLHPMVFTKGLMRFRDFRLMLLSHFLTA